MDQSFEDNGDIVSKDSSQIRDFLEDNDVPFETAKKFEDEDIDGPAFIELSEMDIKSIVPKLGIVKKVMRLQKKLLPPERNPPLVLQNTPSQRDSRSFSPNITSPASTHSPPELFSPLGSPSNDSESDTTSLTSATSLLQQNKFVIPDSWPPAIMACINQPSLEQRRKHLTNSVRNEIVRVLSVQMFCYSPKPGKGFCTQVSQMLVKKYKFMKDTGERVSGYGSWEKKLIEKVMHNAYWKQHKRNHDVNEDEDSTPKPKRGRPAQSQVLTRYPPLRDVGEDDIANQRNKQQLERELEKDRPRKETILQLSRQTFGNRRLDILGESSDVSASSILTKYNELQKSYVIIQEIDLILERQDVFKLAMTDWKTKWVPAILQYAYQCSGKAAALILQAQKNYEGDLAVDEKTALAALCILLPKKGVKDALVHVIQDFKGTDNLDNVCTSTEERSAPRLASFPSEHEWQYFLLVESEVVCPVTDFSQAVCLWFALHYVLNLEYSTKVREVALFFQEFVFKLPATSGTKKQKTVTYLTVTTGIESNI